MTNAADKVNTDTPVIYDADSALASLYETPPAHDRAWSSYLRGECYVCGASARTCHTALRVSTKFTGEDGWETALANHAGPADVFGSCGHYLFTFARRLRGWQLPRG